MPYINVENPVSNIVCANGTGSIAIRHGNNVSLVHETLIRGRMTDNLRILQTSANKIQIYIQSEVSSPVCSFFIEKIDIL